MIKNIIFTDIDGVLQINNPKKWNKKCCKLYSDICNEYNLLPVITSTWRVNYTLYELQNIFYEQCIDVEIYDYTEILGIERGEEISIWLSQNDINNYIIIDDNIKGLTSFVNNIIKVEKSYIGLTENNIKEIKEIIKKW